MIIPERLSHKQDFYGYPEEKASARERNICSTQRIQQTFYFVKIKVEHFFDFLCAPPVLPVQL